MKCSCCGKNKPKPSFRKRSDTKLGYSKRCRECSKFVGSQWKRRDEMFEQGLLWCAKCRQWKEIADFQRGSGHNKGFQNYCRRCVSDNPDRHDRAKMRQEMLSKGLKYCGACKRWKELSAFNKNACARDGFQAICRECKKPIDKRHRPGYAKRRLEKERQRRYANPEKYREKRRRDYEKRKPKLLEYIRSYRRKNKDWWREWNIQYHKNHPEVYIASAHTRRTKLRANGGKHTGLEWLLVRDYYAPDGKCPSCHKDPRGFRNIHKKYRKLTLDHVVPVNLGGTSDISNIQPLCFRCNNLKRKSIVDYRRDAGLFARLVQERLV